MVRDEWEKEEDLVSRLLRTMHSPLEALKQALDWGGESNKSFCFFLVDASPSQQRSETLTFRRTMIMLVAIERARNGYVLHVSP